MNIETTICEENKEAVFERYSNYATRIARKLYRRTGSTQDCERCELEQAAHYGLAKAISNYKGDPEVEQLFKAHSYKYITGEIYSFLNERSFKSKHYRELSRQGKDSKIIEGIELDREGDVDSYTQVSENGVETKTLKKQIEELMRTALRDLAPEEHKIITELFHQDKSLRMQTRERDSLTLHRAQKRYKNGLEQIKQSVLDLTSLDEIKEILGKLSQSY